MFDKLKNIVMSEELLANIFNNMMEDRDNFDEKGWLKRYALFLSIITREAIKSRKRSLSKEDRDNFIATMAYEVYTKKYDKKLEAMHKNIAEA